MAERRMFAKSIVLSDAFLDMPLSARCLYFTLGMFADDDGFVNSPKGIMRQCGASADDLNVLLVKKFIIWFENGVIVIKHWRINNYLRGDRHIPTKYTELLEDLSIDENGAYTQNNLGIPGRVYPDKDSIGKDSIGKNIPPFIPPEGKSKTANDEIETMLNETAFSDYLKDGIREWLSYKREKGQTYKPKGFKTLLTKITNQLSVESETDIVNDIQECMSRNYAGIFYGTSKKQTVKGQQTTQDWVKQWEDA